MKGQLCLGKELRLDPVETQVMSLSHADTGSDLVSGRMAGWEEKDNRLGSCHNDSTDSLESSGTGGGAGRGLNLYGSRWASRSKDRRRS